MCEGDRSVILGSIGYGSIVQALNIISYTLKQVYNFNKTQQPLPVVSDNHRIYLPNLFNKCTPTVQAPFTSERYFYHF